MINIKKIVVYIYKSFNITIHTIIHIYSNSSIDKLYFEITI